jgi:hypothetical protein
MFPSRPELLHELPLKITSLERGTFGYCKLQAATGHQFKAPNVTFGCALVT